MADLAVQNVSLVGLTPTYGAAAAGDAIAGNDGRIMLHVKNTNAATRDVTITSQKPATPGLAPANLVVTVPATTGDKMIGPFDPTAWNDTTGRVQIAYSATTGVTVAAVRTP